MRILSDSHYYSIILCRKCRLCSSLFCLLVYFLFKICISFLLIDSLSCWRSIILSLKRGSVSLGKKWESPWRFSLSSLQGARVCCVSTSEYTCEWSWKIVQRSYYRRQMIHCEKNFWIVAFHLRDYSPFAANHSLLRHSRSAVGSWQDMETARNLCCHFCKQIIVRDWIKD